MLPTLSLVPFYRLKWEDSNTVLTFAELFFCVVEEEIANGRAVAFKAKCLLCGAVISPFGTEFTGSGRRKWQRKPLLRHLKTVHKASHKQIEGEFSSVASLQQETERCRRMKEKGIETFMIPKKRRAVEDEDCCSKRACTTTPATDPEDERVFMSIKDVGRGLELLKTKTLSVMKSMRVLTANIALSWDKRSENVGLYWNKEIASYYISDSTLPFIYKGVKTMIKALIPLFSGYSLTCDCWSNRKASFKAICYHIHVYHDNHYCSLLLDVIPISDGSAVTLESSFRRLCEEYGLDEKCLITTDNASNNVSCFGESRVSCAAHSINTACTHTMSLTADTSTYILKRNERKEIAEYFCTAETVCSVFKGAAYNDFVSWYARARVVMKDLVPVEVKKPPKSCETRWIGKILYLEWLREYGVAVLRYLLCTGVRGISLEDLHSCVKQLPEVLALLNVMNNALNLLTSEKKASSHLVLPVLLSMKKLFERVQDGLVYRIPQLMVKSFLHELNEGCLSLTEKEMIPFKRASGCYPFLKDIAPELYECCMKQAEEYYQSILKGCTRDQISLLCRCGERFETYLTSVVSLLPCGLKRSPNDLTKALTYRKGGIDSVLLVGKLGVEMSSLLECLVYLSEEDIDWSLNKLNKKRGKKNGKRNSAKAIAEQKKLLEKWKTIGGSYESDSGLASLPSSGTQLMYNDALKELVSDVPSPDLLDFQVKYKSEKRKAKDPIAVMYESCLHVASTEADCERFFRILSLTVCKPYQVNINSSKACMIAFARNYAREIYYSMGNGKQQERSIYEIFLDCLVC